MLQAIIIDDEKFSRDALRKKIQLHCNQVQVIAECANAQEGLLAITQQQPDLVFLDIEMPGLSGLDMLTQIAHQHFSLIFTTAYNQYAIDAIRCGAFDYLLKPVDVQELKMAITRLQQQPTGKLLRERIQTVVQQVQLPQGRMPEKIAVSVQDGMELLHIDSILYMEAEGNYTHIHLLNARPIIASKTLKEFEDLLEPVGFFRIHNASLVPLKNIKRFIKGDGGQIQLINDVVLDVARRRKEELLLQLAKIAPRI